MMRRIVITLCLTLLFSAYSQSQPLAVVPGKSDNWHGFERELFTFNGREAWIVNPHQSKAGNPWIWRAHFPNWHTDMDSILLTRGFHVVYVNTNDMFGSPAAMQVWDLFYEYLVSSKHFSRKFFSSRDRVFFLQHFLKIKFFVFSFILGISNFSYLFSFK